MMSSPSHARHTTRDVERDPVHIPAARVNLLPSEIQVGRQVRKVKQRFLIGVAAVIVVALGVYGSAWLDESRASAALEKESETLRALRAEQQRYALLPHIQTTLTRIDASLADLMTNDIVWERYLDALTSTAPPGVVLTSIEVIVEDPADPPRGGSSSVEPGDLDVSGQEQIGNLVVTGQAPDRETVAAWSDALAGVEGFLVPYLLGSRAIAETGGVEFSIEVTLSSAIRSQAYAVEVAGSETDAAAGEQDGEESTAGTTEEDPS